MIKACLFDLDGVIVDTAKYHFLAWRRLARELGFEFEHHHNEKLKGVSRMESLDILLSVGGIQNTNQHEKESMAEKKNRWYLEYISLMTPSEILPGVSEFLNELRSKEIKLALGSASKNAVEILNRTGLLKAFDEIVDGTKISEAKPNPEVFLLGAALLGVKPCSCVVFEDAISGVQAAHRAGMKCIGVGDKTILNNAEAVIESFLDINLGKINEMLHEDIE